MKVTQNAPPTTTSVEQSKSSEKTKAAKANDPSRANIAGATSGRRESVEISDGARLLQRANELVHASPDVRADRIASLKQNIKDGSYNIESDKIADRLVDEHLLSSFGKNDL